MLSEYLFVYIYLYACFDIDTWREIYLTLGMRRPCICGSVFSNQHSGVSLPDSVIRFWCLNSLAWPENGKPFTAWSLSPSLIQLSPLHCRVHGSVTQDQSHPFILPGMFMLCLCHHLHSAKQNDLLSLIHEANFISVLKTQHFSPASSAWRVKWN